MKSNKFGVDTSDILVIDSECNGLAYQFFACLLMAVESFNLIICGTPLTYFIVKFAAPLAVLEFNSVLSALRCSLCIGVLSEDTDRIRG